MAYEDFTGFTEFDEGNDVTVDSATKVSWADLHPAIETAYLYKDKGVAHFDGDFTHKLEISFSVLNKPAIVQHWMIANMIGDWRDIYVANGDIQSLFTYRSATTIRSIYVRIAEDGVVADSDLWNNAEPSTLYFIEIVRDDDGGANSTGRLTAYIRTGSHSGALQDTLIVDCSAGEQNDFRYLYALATDDAGGVDAIATGFTQNLDLGEVQIAAPTGIFYGPLVGPLGGPI